MKSSSHLFCVASAGRVLAFAALTASAAAHAQTPKNTTGTSAVRAPVAAPVAPAAQAATKSPDLGHAAGTPDPKDSAAARAGVASSTQWSTAEIEQAQHACVALLKDLDIVAVGAAPMRENDCGTPAPIELISVGKAPQVTFNPPVVVTCDMAAALHKWVGGDLQKLAKQHLGAPLIRIETMSSYSCRTAYGRAKNKLSEHGRANAIDIRAFMTAKAEAADVLAHWGPTERDIIAQIAAAKAAEEKQKAIAAQQQQQKQPANAPTLAGSNPSVTGSTPPAVADGSRPGVVIGIPGAPGATFPSSTPSAIGLSNGMPPASRLGGPKPAKGTAPEPVLRGTTAIDQTDGRMKFLKGAHVSACKIFGTVLGPESNNAHRNHFHVDMAKRATTSFCE